MCWIGDINNMQIAEEDIKIFKVMKIECGQLVSYFMDSLYELEKERTSKILIERESPLGDEVSFALHSYNSEKLKVLKIKKIFHSHAHTYLRIIRSEMRIVELYEINTENPNVIIVEGIIPKGSNYCENYLGEMISDKLIMKRIWDDSELEERLFKELE